MSSPSLSADGTRAAWAVQHGGFDGLTDVVVVDLPADHTAVDSDAVVVPVVTHPTGSRRVTRLQLSADGTTAAWVAWSGGPWYAHALEVGSGVEDRAAEPAASYGTVTVSGDGGRVVYVAPAEDGGRDRHVADRTVVVTGRVLPARPGVEVQLRVDGGLLRATGRTAADGSYRLAWQPVSAGRYRLHVVSRGDLTHAAGRSADRAVRVG